MYYVSMRERPSDRETGWMDYRTLKEARREAARYLLGWAEPSAGDRIMWDARRLVAMLDTASGPVDFFCVIRKGRHGINARFWDLVNGSPVKLTILPGAGLTWGSYRPTEEGWTSEMVQWNHNLEAVYRQTRIDGADCDGRLTREQLDCCAIGGSLQGIHPAPTANLAPGPFDAYRFPQWERVGGTTAPRRWWY